MFTRLRYFCMQTLLFLPSTETIYTPFRGAFTRNDGAVTW